MPQMGESVAEGTIVRWIKKVGDSVDRDEPLFEISTDKVDAEIPSPAAGVVKEIRAKEGDTVAVNTVVAIIEPAGAAVKSAGTAAAAAPASSTPQAPMPATGAPAPETRPRQAPPSAATPSAAPSAASAGAAPQAKPPHAATEEDAVRQRSSPVVRKIAKEHNVDISSLHGTGIAGRVTKNDILSFLGNQQTGTSQTPPSAPGAPAASAVSGRSQPAAGGAAPARPTPPSTAQRGTPGHVEKMSVMRKRIAEHMVLSKRTSAHVHTVFDVNFTRVAAARAARKAEFEKAGAKLTYLSFILRAACEALRAVPVINASVDGDNIVYHDEVNIGIAVALDWGLIVPVVKKADEKNLLGISRTVVDLAARARAKQLKPEEVSGGTFTITNPGGFGALFGTPIINQPQVAILGIGAIEKRAVVIDDAIGIRQMGYLTLGYDHRIIDGAVADEFMAHVKRTLESWEPSAD
jgi:2-oxoglutarate dehydrogenase E2 component (dihydrolipoamide succinyltransferase)